MRPARASRGARWRIGLMAALALGCRREGIHGDDAGPVAPSAKTDAAEPPTPLLGRWRADATGRQLDARAKGDTYTFHVVSAKEWGGAYQAEEVRFALRADGGGYRVVDRFRPFAQPNAYVDDGARAACTTELTADHEGKPLRARLVDSDALEIDFARVDVRTVLTVTGTDEIETCKPPTVVGRLTVVLRRVK